MNIALSLPLCCFAVAVLCVLVLYFYRSSTAFLFTEHVFFAGVVTAFLGVSGLVWYALFLLLGVY